MPEPARLTILCGLPGSGKTTLARELEATTGAVRMCPDEELAAAGVDLWDQAARAAVEARQWEEAKGLLAAGRSVVIEWGVWHRAERDQLRAGARALGAAVELRYLDVPLDELARRVAGRWDRWPEGTVEITADHLRAWREELEPPDAEELAGYDPPAS